MNQRIRQVGGALLAATVGLSSLAALASPAQAAPPARIKGIVTAPGGAPLAGIHVSTLKWQASAGEWQEMDSDTTGVDGRYSVGKLLSGTYRVRYYDATGALATEFYNDKARAADADPIDVSVGPQELAPTQLGGAAHLAGTVTDRAGVAIGNAEVTAYVVQDGAWVAFQSVTTDVDGDYDLGGLPGGSYTLGFHDPVTQTTEYWNNRTQLADAHTLTVQSYGSTDGLDAQLATPAPEVPPVTPTDPTTPTTPTDPGAPAPAATPTTTTTTPAPAAAPAPTTTTVRKVSLVKMPKIKGFAKVDQRLRVTKGAWNPTAVSRKIQWLANGKKIKGATKVRLRLTSKLAGKKISVKVTASAPGMTALAVKTAATKKVKR